jgi:hypothetical protein
VDRHEGLKHVSVTDSKDSFVDSKMNSEPNLPPSIIVIGTSTLFIMMPLDSYSAARNPFLDEAKHIFEQADILSYSQLAFFVLE